MATRAQRMAIHQSRVMTLRQKARLAAGGKETAPDERPAISEADQERRNARKAIEDLADQRQLRKAIEDGWQV